MTSHGTHPVLRLPVPAVSIFLYVLTPKRDVRWVPVNQVLKKVSQNKSIEKGVEVSLYSSGRDMDPLANSAAELLKCVKDWYVGWQSIW